MPNAQREAARGNPARAPKSRVAGCTISVQRMTLAGPQRPTGRCDKNSRPASWLDKPRAENDGCTSPEASPQRPVSMQCCPSHGKGKWRPVLHGEVEIVAMRCRIARSS